jgi:lysophospholipase L1-like esterase
MKRVAKALGCGFVDINTTCKQACGAVDATWIANFTTGDGVHPNKAGHAAMYPAIRQALVTQRAFAEATTGSLVA